jgi:O-antigen ligase
LIAVAPTVSTSRGGVLILAADSVAVMIVVWLGLGRERWGARMGFALAVALAAIFGVVLGWKELWPRLQELKAGFALREEMYGMGWKMFSDYPAFGTGPGTFNALGQLYRANPEEYWPAQLHNDWLETLATFGVIGAGMIWLALATVFTRWWESGTIRASRYFVWCAWIALAGCLIHARWDFPFQMYSIVHLFLVISAMLMGVSQKTEKLKS